MKHFFRDISNQSEIKMATEPINQLNLVGNFLEKDVQGDDFPKIPTKNIQFKIVGKLNTVEYCLSISNKSF